MPLSPRLQGIQGRTHAKFKQFFEIKLSFIFVHFRTDKTRMQNFFSFHIRGVISILRSTC